MPEQSSAGSDRVRAQSGHGPRKPPSIPDHALLCRIGQGAYGEVWLARNAVGTLRAVKVVYRDAFADARPYEREFAGIQKFEPISRSHEGLVDILQIGINEPAGYFYYVMELADDSSESRLQPASALDAGNRAEESPSAERRAAGVGTYVPRTLASDRAAQGRLSFAECLRVGFALADALECLHEHDLVHRDIKPSNIIFVNGSPKLADIGLVTETTNARTFVGTEGFIAPEGPGTPQADVFSLGKVLYEISTGKDRKRFPEPLTALGDLPDHAGWLEFNEVVRKACEGDPKQRYASASDLRAELALLLGGKSVRRLRRAEQRLTLAKKLGVAAALLLIAGFFVLWGVLSVARERERALIMQELQTTLLSPHFAGWSSNMQAKVRAAARIHKDTRLQALAAASLGGIDAWEIQRLTNFDVMTVTFDSAGQRVLAGGARRGALLWETNKALPVSLESPGPGPAVFQPDGTPVQLAANSAGTFVLWNLTAKFAIQTFKIPSERNWDELPKGKRPVLAISPDCSTVAGAAATLDGTGAFAVWGVASGRELFRGEQLTTALAFSPDGQFLATGAQDGCVKVFRARGEGTPLATNNFSRTAVRSLAFQKTVNRHVGRPGPLQNWLLAVGEASSTVRLWYLDDARPPGVLVGCEHDVEALAFDPGGVLLAAAGHGEVRLFDTTSGKMSLVIPTGVGLTIAVAFDPNGTHLVSGGGYFDSPGAAVVYALERGRGIQMLHGLEGVVQQVRLSRDGRYIAALAQNWRIAVWDRVEGRLRHVFDAPRGVSTDNAGLAFSPDAGQFAAKAGREAVWWNIATDTGEEMLRRSVPEGLTEQLAFSATNKLMLFQLERKDGLGGPKSQDALNAPPQICCIRNLVPTNWHEPVSMFGEFNWGVLASVASPDGRYFLAEGISVGEGTTNRRVAHFDASTGARLTESQFDTSRYSNGALKGGLGGIDPTGEFFTCSSGPNEQAVMVRIGTTNAVRVFRLHPVALGGQGEIWARTSLPDLGNGLFLFEGSEDSPTLAFGPLHASGHVKAPLFDLTGRFICWGNTDGTVSVADLEKVKRNLAELGLDR